MPKSDRPPSGETDFVVSDSPKETGSLSDLRRMMSGASAKTLGTSLLAQILILASGVVAARALGVEDRGYLALFWLSPMVISLIGGLGIPQATTYFVARDTANARPVVGLAARISATLAIVLVLIYGFALSLPFAPTGGDLRIAGLLSVILIPAFLAQTVGLGALQGQQRFSAFNAVRIVAPVVYVVGIVAVYVGGVGSLASVMGVAVASWTAGAVISWLVLLRNLPANGSPPKTDSGQMLRFGIRGVLGSVSPIDDLRVDQLLVGFVVDARALGLYVAAIAFCNLPRFIAQSIGLVSYPRIASARSVEGAWTVIHRAARIGIGLLILTITALLLIVPTILPFFFGEEFESAVGLARILLLAAFFLSLRRLFTEFCRGLGHPGYGSIGEAVSALLLVAGVVVLGGGADESSIAWVVLCVSAISSSLLAALLLRLRAKR